ncbi:uncharacterized protein MEPE_05754 [Melanopsichium pennsylvanicum]|uniref:Queuosine 5'-phosphate N-glycosylase/hydrolase n=1 Tax=Melanopsichium pennsylvanicum TaxID=63383 RepID=A0AAJ5C819_9BASI|nr:uncharacterized protein MEPE_05754 [Melanopsichium pennsylvanicum]
MSACTSNPLPPSDEYIEFTRESCKLISQTLGFTPNVPSIDTFLLNLSRTSFEKIGKQHGLNFPLRFPTFTAEVNFLATLALLNGFSGYRTEFHQATGMGAYQNIVRLMMGLYISGSDAQDKMVGVKSLTAKGMSEITETRIVELLGVSVHEEKPHETLVGVTVGTRGGPMLNVVQLIVTTLNNVGKTLLSKKFESLGSYVVSLLQQVKTKEQLKNDDVKATDFLVKCIAETFAEFRDTHIFTQPNKDNPDSTINVHQVYLFKRIFFLLHSLYLRFGTNEDWKLPNTYKTLPMFVDNVLPTLCVWFNLINVPKIDTFSDKKRMIMMKNLIDWMQTQHCNSNLTRENLANLQNNISGPILTKDETYAIRASCLHVGQVMVERAKFLAEQSNFNTITPLQSHHNHKDGGVQQFNLEWLLDFNEVDLDGYLWALAKHDQDLRKIPRFVFPCIHF